MKPVRLDSDYIIFDESVLLCPECGSNYLHQTTVEVYHGGEDGDGQPAVAVKGQKVSISTEMVGNPSPRRSGLRIWFWCENCAHDPTLSLVIYQHKGQTFAGWEEVGDE